MNNEISRGAGSRPAGKKLSVVIPAFNEESRIEKTLTEVSGFLKKQSFEYEILVVVDGANDDTAGLVGRLSSVIPNLQLISNQENHGKGYVVRQGILKASGDVRLFMDADNSTKVDEIIKFLPFFDSGYDVVVGSRRVEGAVIALHQSGFRDFLGGVFRFIVHTLVPVDVTDSQCGFKAFSASAAEAIFPKQTIFRWAFDVEILAIARRAKLKIKELPITWVNDAESHVKLGGMIDMFFEVLEVRKNLWTGKYKYQKYG